MKLNATLDFDVVAVEQEDTVHVLLELAAPSLPEADERPPATLEVVLDRSDSMDDRRLYAALGAIHSLIGRLRSEDRFGLDALRDGEAKRASERFRAASDMARNVHPGSPQAIAELQAEINLLRDLAESAEEDSIRTRKRAIADQHMKNRRRGRH